MPDDTSSEAVYILSQLVLRFTVRPVYLYHLCRRLTQLAKLELRNIYCEIYIAKYILRNIYCEIYIAKFILRNLYCEIYIAKYIIFFYCRCISNNDNRLAKGLFAKMRPSGFARLFCSIIRAKEPFSTRA